MKPVLLTRFVEQVGYNEAFSGLIVAMPFVGIAVASLAVKPLTRLLSTTMVFMFFGLTLLLSEMASMYLFDQPALIVTLQFAGGLAVGILMGTTSQLIAISRHPDEIFGFVDMTAVFLMSFMIAGIGKAVGMGGLFSGYLVAAGIAFLLFLLLFAYKGNEATISDPSNHEDQPLEFSVRNISVVLMGVLFVTCSGLGFAFMFTMAQNLGLSYEQAGSKIGILLLVSAAACQLGGWCSARFGPLRPLGCAFLTCGLGWYIAVNTDSAVVFIAALVPAIFSLQFNFPILLALSGSLDKTGQWAGVATPLLTSGFAWAAITAGIVVQNWGLNALGPATVLGMLTCLALLALVAKRTP